MEMPSVQLELGAWRRARSTAVATGECLTAPPSPTTPAATSKPRPSRPLRDETLEEPPCPTSFVGARASSLYRRMATGGASLEPLRQWGNQRDRPGSSTGGSPAGHTARGSAGLRTACYPDDLALVVDLAEHVSRSSRTRGES